MNGQRVGRLVLLGGAVIALAYPMGLPLVPIVEGLGH
jgi:hypothetical protein